MHPSLARAAQQQYGVFLATQALLHGYSRDEIARSVAQGRWVRLHRGVYTDASWYSGQTEVIQHLAKARGVQLQLGAQAAWSHRTAALAYGLPLLHSVPDVPEITVEREERRTANGARLYSAALKPGHVDFTQHNARITSVARTVCDVARIYGEMAGLVSADAAARLDLLRTDDVAVVLRDCKMWRGIPRFKRVLPLVDARSESPGETVSRWLITKFGIPMPELQHEIVVSQRRFRTDFCWPRYRLIGEFDGRVKYGGADDLFADKRREDALRADGWAFARWTWSDLWGDPTPPFIVMLRRHLAQSAA